MRALDYLKERYRDPITVRDVADAARLSGDRLAHRFRDEVGFSVKDFLMRLRVAVGRRLLTETDHKVDAIARELGFGDASHFSRVFTEFAGARPGEYRRRGDQAGPKPMAV